MNSNQAIQPQLPEVLQVWHGIVSAIFAGYLSSLKVIYS